MEIIQNVAFSAWLLSLSTMRLRSIHVVACIDCSFLLLSNISVNGYTTVCLSTPMLRDILLFEFLAVMHKAAIKFVYLCVCVCEHRLLFHFSN